MKDNTERIIRRIKRLLATAEGEANMNESHTAFLLAQEMMVKYGVAPEDVTDDEEVKEVLTDSGTEYKRLFWYERKLARIVADNFRCKDYYQGTTIQGKKQLQYRIMFMGLDKDVELASTMYRLVISALNFYTQKYIKEFSKGVRRHTQSLKNDYINGFIDGLERKFEEQIQEHEWGLVLVVSEDVEKKYEQEVTGGAIKYKIPDVEAIKTYQKGYKEGNAIDYKKETIDGDII